MNEGRDHIHSRSRARASRNPGGITERPDRAAFWALVMALVALVAAVATADGSPGSGGVGSDDRERGKTGTRSCHEASFGDRRLSLGDCGLDVTTLNWILKSERYDVKLNQNFRTWTEDSVRRLQRRNGLRRSGVVTKKTRRAVVRTMSKEIATWYGPGFFGNRTACGQTLTRKTVGVAHRTLPCGTRVTLKYKGRFLRTKVIDRGPYANDANWDLTQKASKKLRMYGTDRIRVAPISRGR